ncbi:synaptic vesicle glycoprotein 2C [Nomia melanderi]|uniref:synaptic vesicle glycoprotein 2C n=1 Tax=Nomia melanderi TaxID=2448451 RepID=UPI00130446B2|nr:synaptic vesicle glycoprotein 2A-like [Nomia melanderi]XP_031832422.1 synaptic vesicle glycoprotein 2A-like [Nomia melanderi]XP_031832424.1 synaptic vesicle glycoprotein 2A-like [Nomia melanderi]XP_031832425.1 synaptic vesicle glycoprotein 2A-like [Nomia melanderi]XP_031832426.1 synaptic vesicle glycoprotein 2A-like [Nomia melanderi]XP_031832427.1 synaptic vesicle glycoprotein 2A-like [Nomia melanderi]
MPVDSKTRISIALNQFVGENKCDNDENVQKEKLANFETAIAASGYGKFQYLLLLTIIPVTWSTSIDTSNVSIILPSAECDLQMTLLQKGLLNAVTFVGMVSSGYLWGYIADVRGRRSVFIYGYLADGICNILSGFSQNFWTLMFFKFLSGFIISGPHASIVTYCSEFHGIKGRVRIPLIIGFSINLGNIVTSGLAWLVIPQPWSIVLWDGGFIYNSWRIFLSVCGMPALFGVICLALFPESPKFLMSQGRNKEALRVFKLIYRINTGRPAEEYPIQSLEDEPLRKSMANSDENRKSQRTAIFFYPHLPWLLLVTTMQFGAMLTMNTIRLWQPQLFTILENFNSSNYNATSGESSFCEILDFSTMRNATEMEETCVNAAVSESVYIKTVVIASLGSFLLLLATISSHFLGHKKLLLISYGLAFTSILYMNWSTNIWVTMAITCIFVGLMLTTVNMAIGIAVILFPTSLRTIAVSLVMTSGRIGSVIGNILFPVLLEYGCLAPMIALSGFVLMCIVLGCLLPSRRAEK